MGRKLFKEFAFVVALILGAATATAHDFEVDGIYYKYIGNSSVKVTYKGSTYNEYAREYSGDVVIPASVTYLGTTYSVTFIDHSAFSNCVTLTSVTIPNSVTVIGNNAFSNCTDLKSVSIPNSVKTIGLRAFGNCSLTSVSIPNSVTLIGEKAFSYCDDLTSITIGNSVKTIESSAFENCRRLTKVVISSIDSWLGIKFSNYYSNPLPYAEHLYLNGEEVKDLVIPDSCTSIGDFALTGCRGLKSVAIPNSVTSIGDSAFMLCTGMTSITIPNSVTSIGKYAFQNCSSLTSITIPNSVTSISEGTFCSCVGLKEVFIPNSVETIGNQVFEYCSGMTSVTIPNSVTSIGNCAFHDCSGLTSITIPNSVTSIGYDAFDDCSGLTRVDISSIETWLAIKFKDSESNPLSYANHLYINGEEVKDLVIPDSLTSIGDYAFAGCSGLTSVTIPNSVTSIGVGAFNKCSNLTRVDISSIESWLGIEFNYYDSNPLLYAKHLYLNGEEVKDLVIPESVTSIGDYAFFECEELTSVTIPNSVISIGGRAFSCCSNLTSISIGNSVTYIGDYAFYNCSKLEGVVTIPDLVTSIGYATFRGCSSVTRVYIGNSVTSIGDYAFYQCSGLTSVTIPNSVTSIGYATFWGCSSLASVSLGNSLTSIGEFAFNDCSSLTSVILGNSLTSIGHYAFKNCSSIQNIIIPNSVTLIGSSAFSGCSSLTSISIGSSVASIGYAAFGECGALKTILYNAENCDDVEDSYYPFSDCSNIIIGKNVKRMPKYLFYYSSPARVVSHSVTPPTCDSRTFGSGAYTASLYVPSIAKTDYSTAYGWKNFSNIIPISNTIREIKLEQGEFGLTVGGTLKLNATITPSNATLDVLFWSSDSPVAIVDRDGNVTGICEGTATITAEALDGSGVKATCRVSVKNSIATSILLNPAELKLDINQTGTITSEILPAEASNKTVAWSTSNSGVATFKDNNDGSISVLGVANGTATITARTTDGSDLSATCEVTVGIGAVEGVETAEARVYTTNGNIIIAATEDGEAAVYDFTGRLIKRVPVAVGDNTTIPVIPGCYIVKSGATRQSVIVK